MIWERQQRGPLCDVFGAGSAVGGVAQAAGTVAAAGIQAAATTSAASTEADASKYASDQSLKAATQANDLQKTEFNTAQANTAPYRQAGAVALGQLSDQTGWGKAFASDYQPFTAPTQFSFNPSDLQNDPGYQFQLGEGLKALQATQASTGITGGDAAKQIAQYSQGLANTTYNQAYNRAQGTFQQNYEDAAQSYGTNFNVWNTDKSSTFNRLASIAGIGQTATGQLNQAGSNAANQQGYNLTNAAAQSGYYGTQAANAGAAGMVSLGNIGAGAVTSLTNNSSYSSPGGLGNSFAAANYNLNPTTTISPAQWAAYDAGSTPTQEEVQW